VAGTGKVAVPVSLPGETDFPSTVWQSGVRWNLLANHRSANSSRSANTTTARFTTTDASFKSACDTVLSPIHLLIHI
jgi:hypothetical protein